MLKQKYWEKRIAVVLALLLMIVPFPVHAQETDTSSNHVFLPLVSVGTGAPTQTDVAVVIAELNQQFAGTGLQFFTFEPVEDELQAANIDAENIPTFKADNLLQVNSEEDLIAAVNSIYLATQAVEDETLLEQNSSTDEDVQASGLTNHSKVASWYEAACGTDAFVMGGIFCWKNIAYSYKIDDVQKRVTEPNVTGSYLSGINVLTWTHDGGSANSVNSKTVSLKVRGRYTLGIQYAGITIGAVWSSSWSRTVQPPCAICK